MIRGVKTIGNSAENPVALKLGGTRFGNPELLFDVRPINPLEHQIQEWGWAACLRPRRNNALQASVEPRKAEAAIPSQR